MALALMVGVAAVVVRLSLFRHCSPGVRLGGLVWFSVRDVPPQLFRRVAPALEAGQRLFSSYLRPKAESY